MIKKYELHVRGKPFIFGGEKVDVDGATYYVKYIGCSPEKANARAKNIVERFRKLGLTSKLDLRESANG